MRIAAFAFLAVYALIGLRSIFYFRTWHATELELRRKLGLGPCMGCQPSPRWVRIFSRACLVLTLPADVAFWPITSWMNHRRAGAGEAPQ